MSTASKSPGKVLLEAYEVARKALPAYSRRFSPKKFAQHQLFACLVLKTFLRTDYRAITAMLSDLPSLRQGIEFKTVPDFTTLHKAARRREVEGLVGAAGKDAETPSRE